MIAAIPAQPLAFNASPLQGCVCFGPDRCLPVLPDDLLQVQVAGVLCATSDELIEDTTTTDEDTWSNGGWQQIRDGEGVRQSCIDTEGLGVSPAPLRDLSFNPTVGDLYTVSFTIETISGELLASFAGVDLGVFTSAGTYTFTVTAENTSSWYFRQNADFLQACISYASAKDTNTDVTVRVFRSSTGNQVDSWTMTSKPERFHFDRDHFTADIPVGDIGPGGSGLEDGCYFIRIVDNCDAITLESECINVGDHDCTVLLTGCSATTIGDLYFSENFTLSMRVKAKLVRPSYKFTEKTERLSNGQINRYYIDRQTTYELRISYLDEFGHDAVSLFAEVDHFYIGQTEYVMDAGGYAPDYGDVWDDQGIISIAVRPKQELYRKVMCVTDSGNCSPPPNYWVEGTGPNNDYILSEDDGSRILLNQ